MCVDDDRRRVPPPPPILIMQAAFESVYTACGGGGPSPEPHFLRLFFEIRVEKRPTLDSNSRRTPVGCIERELSGGGYPIDLMQEYYTRPPAVSKKRQGRRWRL